MTYRYVSEAKALAGEAAAAAAAGGQAARGGGGESATSSSHPWGAPSARQIGITYGLGVGLYLRLLVW